ncbi:MAG: membrane integrity-associated transporter subunit PqiC [Candidatus Marinimicrobia bacterium]|nr:membrane integrity-associated transporter subunit PqiC [Candidatus Neomarinimicrobiota bacterium]
MKKTGIVILLSLMVFIMRCAGTRAFSDSFYILQYFQHSEKPELKLKTSFNYSVIVYDTEVNRTYDSKKIVVRHFGPRITYANNHLWGTDISDGVADLLGRRLTAYNIFNQVQRNFRDNRPDYEIVSIINNIEMISSDNLSEVHLNIELYLKKSGDEEYLVKHSSTREEILFNNSMESFVQKANDILLEEADRFALKIENFFNKIEPEENTEPAFELALTDTAAPTGMRMGKLHFPAISGTDNEPQIKIVSKSNDVIFAQPGQEIALTCGTYDIVYGSGSTLQKMNKRNVDIKPMYSTEIEPDWACLLVDVLDERRNYRQVRYEIYDALTGESYGTHYPVKKELGEQQRVWMLKPGLYKLTINNEPFNTYRDFTTVYLNKGKTERLSLVVDVDDNDNPTHLIGGGIIEGQSGEVFAEHWRVSSALHGNFNMNSSNETDEDEYFSTSVVTSQFENRIVYNNMPHYYYMRNLTEIGFTKSTDVDLRLSADEFDVKNTYVLFMLKNLGVYGRIDINSHFFSSYRYSTSKFNYIKQNSRGKEISRALDEKKIKLADGIYPMVLKEGIGVNYRLFNTPKAKLSIRTGLGIRQELYDKVYDITNKNYTEENIVYQLYQEKVDLFNRGTEVSLVGNFNLPFNLSYMTNADILFPFNTSESITVDWENVFNLRLFKHISIYYKLNLQNKQGEDGNEYILNRHSLFLRLTYIIR